jgi:hypothetical protein
MSSLIFSHLRLYLPNGLFPSGFHTKTLHSVFSPFRIHALPISCSLTCICRRVQVWSISLCRFLQPHIISSVLGSNILSALFSNTLSQCPCFNVRDQVLHPYETTIEITVLHFSSYIVRQQTRRQKIWNEPWWNRAWRHRLYLSSPEYIWALMDRVMNILVA